MGGGHWDSQSYTTRSVSKGYHTKAKEEVFTSRSLNPDMNPRGVTLRESRDSDEHPESVAIIIAMDVTGSMGEVPAHLVKEGLPKIMERLMERGIADPQILFMAIGDHMADDAPLQIGQFESSDELLEKWLTMTWLEGRGGGNNGESYALAWYFAGNFTAIDCMEKRGKKGYLFTIGDEPVHAKMSDNSLRKILGDPEINQDVTAQQALELAQKLYQVYHVHVRGTHGDWRYKPVDGWRKYLPETVHEADGYEDVAVTIANTIAKHHQQGKVVSAATPIPEAEDVQSSANPIDEKILL